MSLEENFWRLFGDYERLTRDETTTIREWDFTALATIQAKKVIILDELIRLGTAIGLNRDNPAFNSRVSILEEAEEQNSELLAQEISKTRRELNMLQAASVRLRAVEHVYAPHSPPAEQNRKVFLC